MRWRVNQRWPVTVVVAAVAISFTGFAAAQVPNPLPLQDPPPRPVTVTRYAAGNTSVPVFCAANETVTGGGAFAGGLVGSHPVDGSGSAITTSGTTAARGWRASASTATPVQVWVMCAR